MPSKVFSLKRKRFLLLLLPVVLLAFYLRLESGLTRFGGLDAFQVYLIGLKYFTTGVWPYWGPDVVYTEAQIPGALQGVLVGGPFYLWSAPEAPFVLINLISLVALLFFAWYLIRRLPEAPSWLMYSWLLSAPWMMHYSTIVENPSYVLPPAILFFIATWELLPFYDQKIMRSRWAFFWLGFSLLWIFQLHMSWFILLPFVGLAGFYSWKRRENLWESFLFFSAGLAVTGSFLLPTILRFGLNSGGGTGENIGINLNNIPEGVSILGKFLSFSSAEVVRFIGRTWTERIDFLKNFPIAAPFIIWFMLLGGAQVAWQVVSFFSKKIWLPARILTAGAILLLWLAFLFAKVAPKAHMFYLLAPLSFWYSFYCYQPWYHKKWFKVLAGSLVVSGMVFQVALAISYSRTLHLDLWKQQIVEAIAEKDYSILGTRRSSILERAQYENPWQHFSAGSSTCFKTGFEYQNPVFVPGNIVKSHAQNGQYACKMDSIQPFGLNFQQAIAPDKRPVSVRLSTWMKGSYSGNVLAVCVLKENQVERLWLGQELNRKAIDPVQWQPVNITFAIPDTLQPANELRLFFWLTDKSSGRFYTDDVEICVDYQ